MKAKLKMFEDKFELHSTDEGQYEQVIALIDKERKWLTADADWNTVHPDAPVPKARNLAFFPVAEAPLLASVMKDAEYTKASKATKDKTVAHRKYKIAKDVTAEAIADTMNDNPRVYYRDGGEYSGTSLMVAVDKGDIYPVGWSAMSGLMRALGLMGKGQLNLQSGNVDYLAEVFNLLAEVSNNGFTAMTAFGKFRAFNGPNYAVTSDKFIWDECKEFLKGYPNAKFASGYVSHDITKWTIDMSAYQKDLFGQYAAVVGSAYTPVLIVRTSSTGDSAVRLIPGLKIGDTFVPLAQQIGHDHTAPGSYEQRIEKMKELIKQAFREVVPKFEDAAKEIVELQKIPIKHGRQTLEKIAHKLGFPWKETDAQAQIFQDIYGVEFNGALLYPDLTAYDLWLYLGEILGEATRNTSYNEMFLLGLADGVSRAIRMDWASFDDGSPINWGQKPKNP